ncbi:MAG TPA: tetratricopeptide repeat protein [Kofleriaceae bacterium]|nr:tetratricopeptide repeat protein [Kofleriaceae bacterium]
MNDAVDRVARLLSAGDVGGAEALVAGLTGEPGGAHALGQAVLALYRKDPAAIGHAERALAQGAGAAGHQYLAVAHLAAGHHDQAIDHARKAVAADGSLKSRSGLGGILLACGRPADAAAVLRQVVAEAPHDAEAQMNLGTAAAQTGDYGQAIESYSRSFDENPSDGRPIQMLINMFAEVGKWLGAVAALELSRKGEPPPPVQVALDLVMVHLMRLISVRFPKPGIGEDADQAVTSLAASARGRGLGVQVVVARTLIDVGRVDEARELIAHLAAQAKSDQDRGHARYLEGFLAEKAGDPELALQRYGQSLAADPFRVDACVNAVSLLLENGTPEALARIPALVEQVPATTRSQSPDLLFNHALYLSRTGEIALARANLERILQVTGGDGRLAVLARRGLDELASAPAGGAR